MKKGFWIFKAIKITTAVIVFVLLFVFITMNLWNWLMPLLFHAPVLNFAQTLGLLVLSKILFSGFGRGGGNRFAERRRWKRKMEERLTNMTPEEKETFKANIKNRFGNRFGGFEQKENATAE